MDSVFFRRSKNLKNIKVFPLDHLSLSDFEKLKSSVASATLQACDNNNLFIIECNTSEVAVSATLNQSGHPVAFFSRTLSKCELHYPSLEKEAVSIVESICKWSYLLV